MLAFGGVFGLLIRERAFRRELGGLAAALDDFDEGVEFVLRAFGARVGAAVHACFGLPRFKGGFERVFGGLVDAGQIVVSKPQVNSICVPL